MLIDPLGDRPILVTGSANFSAASSDKNDENMVVLAGNRRVSEIYLGEYLRLWEHYAFREWVSRSKGSRSVMQAPWNLDPSDGWWARYFGEGPFARRREYFAAK